MLTNRHIYEDANTTTIAMPSERCWGQRNHECVKTMVVDHGGDYDYDNEQIITTTTTTTTTTTVATTTTMTTVAAAIATGCCRRSTLA